MNRGMFWLVWAIGLIPMAAAMTMYFGNLGVPDGRVNRGELVPPGVVLEDWEVVDAAGEQWVFAGDWQLLLTYEQVCNPACDHWKNQLSQLHKALGRERNRVRWHTLSGATNTQGVMLASEHLEKIGDGVWVADPLGNLVLRFRFDQAPKELLTDLKRMLKLSKIG